MTEKETYYVDPFLYAIAQARDALLKTSLRQERCIKKKREEIRQMMPEIQGDAVLALLQVYKLIFLAEQLGSYTFFHLYTNCHILAHFIETYLQKSEQRISVDIRYMAKKIASLKKQELERDKEKLEAVRQKFIRYNRLLSTTFPF